MRYHVLAVDYDGTIATRGRVDEETIDALAKLTESGRKLLLVSGRELADLESVFDRLDLFDLAVLENGALLVDPRTRRTTRLGETPPPAFVARLRERGVEPLSVGEVVVATREPHEGTVVDVIRELGLELQVIFNKGAVMVLPAGVNKATGLNAALAELRLSARNTVGVGDAENDHAFLAECECAVAVANALPTLKERADLVTRAGHGAGVRAVVEHLLADDLQQAAPRERRMISLGEQPDAGEVLLPPHGPPILVAGTSGGGKSTLATAVLEALSGHGYSFCIVDPEGDFVELPGAVVLGSPDRAPGLDEVIEILEHPNESAVVNLVGVPLADRPSAFEALFPRLHEMRARTGRPHWIVVDEAHHLMPTGRPTTSLALPKALDDVLLITVHPEHVEPAVLEAVGSVLAIGSDPAGTIAGFAEAVGEQAPQTDPTPLPSGTAMLWRRSAGEAPFTFASRRPLLEKTRHIRKYAAGDLGEEESFVFSGPDGRLKLRAQNLEIFLQMAEGVDDETWLHHLRQGDVTRWFREVIKDEDLAGDAAAVEAEAGDDPEESRRRIRVAVEERYTAPA